MMQHNKCFDHACALNHFLHSYSHMNLIRFHHIQSLVPLWPDTIGMTKKDQTLTHFIMWHKWKIQYLWLNF